MNAQKMNFLMKRKEQTRRRRRRDRSSLSQGLHRELLPLGYRQVSAYVLSSKEEKKKKKTFSLPLCARTSTYLYIEAYRWLGFMDVYLYLFLYGGVWSWSIAWIFRLFFLSFLSVRVTYHWMVDENVNGVACSYLSTLDDDDDDGNYFTSITCRQKTSSAPAVLQLFLLVDFSSLFYFFRRYPSSKRRQRS